MKNFESYQEQEITGCKCCDNYAKLCNCSDNCCDWITMNSSNSKEFSYVSAKRKKRTISAEKKSELHQLLQDYRKN